MVDYEEGWITEYGIKLPVVDVRGKGGDKKVYMLDCTKEARKSKDINEDLLPHITVTSRREFIEITPKIMRRFFIDWCELTHQSNKDMNNMLDTFDFMIELGYIQILEMWDMLLSGEMNIFNNHNEKIKYKKKYKLLEGHRLYMCVADNGRTRFLFV